MDPELWSDQGRAQRVLQEKNHLENMIAAFREIEQTLEDQKVLIQLGEEEGDERVVQEAKIALLSLAEKARKQEIACLFSGEADTNDCFLEIHPGAGGTESQDWAEMLLRMYIRWAEGHGFKVEVIEQQQGEEAGIKSVTLKLMGYHAYGWAKTESGVHRLVRISPFDSGARRHTSFASVYVYPVIDDSINITIEEKEIRVDTFRSSGAGGQHVNTTDSAVRIIHIPTNIIVQCQNNRSQHRNRAEAMAMLRSRLYELELQKKEEEQAKANNAKTAIGWGHQIRSYVLHPYQLVKDVRTAVETSNTSAVLNGQLDEFIMAALAMRITEGK